MRVLAALVLALAAAAPAKAAAPLLQPCSIGDTAARCGTVVVPENRTQPTGKTISLRVAVLPATTKPVRPDPLVYIVGGPGGVATEAVPYVALGFGSINRSRDIVFVDQRGVGGSNPLTCAFPPPTFQGTFDDFVRGCAAGTGADLTRYRTTDAVDDLESVRIALGYGAFNIYGGSYGGTVVQVYVQQHPEGLRTAIMDSSSTLDVPVFERWGSSAQRALLLIQKRCVRDGACGKAFPHWYQRFPALLQRLSRHPVRGITAAATANVIEDMTTTVYGAAEVPFVIARAEAGVFTPLARQIALRRAQESVVPIQPHAIMCTEPWAVRDPARVWADAKRTYMRYSSWTPASVQERAICAALPAVDTSTEDWRPVRSTLPMLNLVGGADPKDPPRNSARFTSDMPNGKQIIVPDQGHGVALAGCMPRVIESFLDAGTAKGLDTACVSVIGTPAFRLR